MGHRFKLECVVASDRLDDKFVDAVLCQNCPHFCLQVRRLLLWGSQPKVLPQHLRSFSFMEREEMLRDPQASQLIRNELLWWIK